MLAGATTLPSPRGSRGPPKLASSCPSTDCCPVQEQVAVGTPNSLPSFPDFRASFLGQGGHALPEILPDSTTQDLHICSRVFCMWNLLQALRPAVARVLTTDGPGAGGQLGDCLVPYTTEFWGPRMEGVPRRRGLWLTASVLYPSGLQSQFPCWVTLHSQPLAGLARAGWCSCSHGHCEHTPGPATRALLPSTGQFQACVQQRPPAWDMTDGAQPAPVSPGLGEWLLPSPDAAPGRLRGALLREVLSPQS